VSDRSTPELAVGRRRRAIDRHVEEVHGFAIEAMLTPPAE